MAKRKRSAPYAGGRGGILFNPHARLLLLVVTLGLAAALVLWLWGSARDWTWGRLGYAWIPSLLWLSLFALAARYRFAWIKRFWRPWTASMFLVAATVGLLSLFEGTSGVLEESSLGGHWGKILGGSRRSLGIIKVAVLLAFVPPILSPHRAGRAYIQGGKDLLQAARASLVWTGEYVAGVARGIWKQIRSLPLGQVLKGLGHKVLLLPRKQQVDIATEPEPYYEASVTEEAPAPLPVEQKPSAPQRDRGPVRIYGWHVPSDELLEKGQSPASPRPEPEQMAKHIVATLAEHGVEVAVRDIRVGPRVIRFGLVPGWAPRTRDGKAQRASGQDGLAIPDSVRVKVHTILAREKDLALALKTPHIRIEAPVPGEAIVGLEVPNPNPTTVPLRLVAESPRFQKITAKGGLPIAMGQNTAGDPVVVDLIDLPHLLIAGATGSGKSVCLNAVISSLLLANRPDRLRLLMMDPKRVELTPFNGIPHLVTPVIVDPDDALQSLRGVVAEMFRRYRMMEEVAARNIAEYNRKGGEQMPYLVVIVDELADLMISAAYEAEQALVRLAQLGRATGVHLLLATQRPSVNVVTGLLKANIPARIAFAVASQVDSRVILDGVGAERLLGKGDMLYQSQDSPKPIRVQGAIVTDREIEKMVDFWKEQKGPALPTVVLQQLDTYPEQDEDQGPEDDLLDRARELAERLPRLSTSVLQRRLQIGYSKAIDLMDRLQEEGAMALHEPR